MRRLAHQSITIVLTLLLPGASCLAGTTASATGATGSKAVTPQKIMWRRCAAGCHQKLPDGGLSRISRERQTPEGWDMVITRMRIIHHLEIDSAEQSALVKYLADTQGLAPAEAKPYRYILERRPNVVEQVPTGIVGLCAACHSFARVGLQRRNAGEWLKHINFHLGQWPTLEYQARLRSVHWWEEASTKAPRELGRRFPLETAAWKQWRTHKSPDLSGEWRVVGHEPGAGDYRGTLRVNKNGVDSYKLSWILNFASGSSAKGSGSAIVYTGYEWRATATLDGKDIRQVLALTPDGNSMSGRWYYFDADERGGDMSAVRVVGRTQLLAVQPSALHVGAPAQLTVVGINLKGAVKLGQGVTLVKVVRSGPDEMVVTAQAEPGAEDGRRDVTVGSVRGRSMLMVYHRLDSVRIEPDFAIARVGGNGGPLPPVTAQFEAVGYLGGAADKAAAKTVRVGAVPAKWSVTPWDDTAAQMHDAEFAGQMDATGLFTPAGAGPNPKRPFSTNNTGNLKVQAAVGGDGETLKATAHLIVSVQRWKNPPIR